jgi:hypothetical protein
MWAQPSTVNPSVATLAWGETLLVAGITAVVPLHARDSPFRAGAHCVRR